MKRSKFTDEQILGIVREGAAGRKLRVARVLDRLLSSTYRRDCDTRSGCTGATPKKYTDEARFIFAGRAVLPAAPDV